MSGGETRCGIPPARRGWVTVACGDLDVPFLIARSRQLAGWLPNGRYQVLPGMAHQPYLEQPDTVAQLVIHAVAQG